jgi:hypothetical protein
LPAEASSSLRFLIYGWSRGFPNDLIEKLKEIERLAAAYLTKNNPVGAVP